MTNSVPLYAVIRSAVIHRGKCSAGQMPPGKMFRLPDNVQQNKVLLTAGYRVMDIGAVRLDNSDDAENAPASCGSAAIQ